jgi:hypothetical protein
VLIFLIRPQIIKLLRRPVKKLQMQGARKVQGRRVSKNTRGFELFAATQQMGLFQRPAP